MTDATKLEPFDLNAKVTKRYEDMPESVKIAMIRPNGVFAAPLPPGVPQHELARPHFAFDQPIEFKDIKAGDENVWFSKKNLPLLWDASDEASLTFQPGSPIIEAKAEGGGVWRIDFAVDEDLDPDDVVSAKLFTEHQWRPYRRYLWVPLGWGTDEGYPSTGAARKELLEAHAGSLHKIAATAEFVGESIAATTYVHELSTEYLDAMAVSDRKAPGILEFVLFPKLDTTSFDGQGDRIPDMPNQQDGQGQQGGGGGGQSEGESEGESEGNGSGAGSGQSKDDEIPPMPGEGGYSLEQKYDYTRQDGWWGSQTGA